MKDWRDILKSLFPREANYLYRLLRDRSDDKAVLAFIRNSQLPISLPDKIRLVHKTSRSMCVVGYKYVMEPATHNSKGLHIQWIRQI